ARDRRQTRRRAGSSGCGRRSGTKAILWKIGRTRQPHRPSVPAPTVTGAVVALPLTLARATPVVDGQGRSESGYRASHPGRRRWFLALDGQGRRGDGAGAGSEAQTM
ncbi:MAG: hypothetical protein AVDCRST_MAG49-4289, partial [uncultured Thermomicrobiales bacterium]